MLQTIVSHPNTGTESCASSVVRFVNARNTALLFATDECIIPTRKISSMKRGLSERLVDKRKILSKEMEYPFW